MHFFEFKLNSNNRVASIVLYTTTVSTSVKSDVKQERGKLWLVVSHHLKPKGTPSHVL